MNNINYESRYSCHKIINNYPWPILIDLHLHTTKSDGNLTPSQLIKFVDTTDLQVISITDHDNINGINEAEKEVSIRKNLTLINGIELSTKYKDKEIHLLGYFIDTKSKLLKNKLDEIKEGRIEFSKKILYILEQKNIFLSWDKIFASTSGIIGRPHIAKAMIEKKYVSSINEAFEKYLNDENIMNIKRFSINTYDAIEIIQGSGGISSIAHPKSIIDFDSELKGFVDTGLSGIEVYAEKYQPKTQNFFMELCKKYNLIPTGGTDYHANMTSNEMTPGMNGPPYEIFGILKDRARSIHKKNIGQKI